MGQYLALRLEIHRKNNSILFTTIPVSSANSDEFKSLWKYFLQTFALEIQ